MGYLDRLKNRGEKNRIKAQRIRTVAAETGWSEDEAKRRMQSAKKQGITNYNYVSKRAYELAEEEIPVLSRLIRRLKEIKDEDRLYYAGIVQLRTGWDADKALARIKEAEEKGISFSRYVHSGCWTMTETELEAFAAEARADEARIKEKKLEYIDGICAQTGWSRGKAELEVCRAREKFGASYEDFYRFRFHSKTDEERAEYPTLRTMDKFRARYCSFEPRCRYFDDKAEFNRTFADFVKRRWFTNQGLTYESFLKQIDGIESVLVKPITDTCGNGISRHMCNVSEEENRKLYDFIMSVDNTLVEEYIIQHEDMMKLCPTSVNTVRINTMNWKGECIFQFAVVRTGTGSVVDNFHNGGIAARVDVETGIINADATDLDGNIFEVNPYSGIRLRGYRIPHWEMILDACREISGRVEGVDYIGWDFAVTPDGIDLIEGNEGAYVMPQMCYLQDSEGLRPVLEGPYMEG